MILGIALPTLATLKKYLIGFALLGIGFLCGTLVRTYPFLEFDPEIKITDLANLFLLVFLTLGVPIFVSLRIERKAELRTVVGGEIQELIENVSALSERLVSLGPEQTVAAVDFSEATLVCRSCSRTLSELLETGPISISSGLKAQADACAELLYEYWDLVTGDAMRPGLVITESFHRRQREKALNLVNKLRRLRFSALTLNE